jgi:hypothetical protein
MTSIATFCGSCSATGLVVDDLHVATVEVVDDVTGAVADDIRVEGIGRVVLVIEEHERIAVLVRERRQRRLSSTSLSSSSAPMLTSSLVPPGTLYMVKRYFTLPPRPCGELRSMSRTW